MQLQKRYTRYGEFMVRYRLRNDGEYNRPGRERPLITAFHFYGVQYGFETVRMPDGRLIFLHPHEWNGADQCVIGEGEETDQVNQQLSQIRTDLTAVFNRQREAYEAAEASYDKGETLYVQVSKPTHKSIWFEYKHEQQPNLKATTKVAGQVTGVEWDFAKEETDLPAVLTLESKVNSAVALYLKEIQSVGRKDPKGRLVKPNPLIISRWQLTQGLLHRYQKTPATIRDLTPRWADGFHTWLQTQPSQSNRKTDGPISAGYATRHVRRLAELVSWLHRTKGVLAVNPLAGMSWPNYETKEITALDEEQLAALEAMECSGTLAVTKWWFLLMCYTGMDYPDALAYVQQPAKFEKKTVEGMTIQGKRLKTPHTPFCIPKLPRVEQLLQTVPQGAPLDVHTLNRYTRTVIAPSIGFEGPLTVKIARKTAAHFFHEQGLNVSQVSQILGHRTVAVTERHYFRTSERTVINRMRSSGIMNRP